MSSPNEMAAIAGPPYAPKIASLGGIPTNSLDTPVSAVFLVLFIIGAVANMTLFQRNKRRGHKFIPSGAMFGFCMARIVAQVLRIALANRPHNVSLAIAAQVFVAAGVVIFFILNLLFSQRILRAFHPHIGWARPVSIAFKALYVCVVLSLVMLITTVVQSFYTLNANTRRIDRDIMLYGSTYFAFMSFLPFPILALVWLLPHRPENRETFGAGCWKSRVTLLLTTAFLLCLGATFRAGTNIMPPRPRDDPAWYQSKACFYIFNFTLEILVVYIYLLGRVDQRFYVPDGSSKVRTYRVEQCEKANEQHSTEEVNGLPLKTEPQTGA